MTKRPCKDESVPEFRQGNEPAGVASVRLDSGTDGTDGLSEIAFSSSRRRRWWKEPPAYCGAIEPHRFGPIGLVWCCGTRYFEIKRLGVFKRV